MGGDNAHAGHHWKKFVQRGGQLIHEADIDMEENIMNKNLEKLMRRILFDELIGGK